jgi:hypothetical protein
VEPFGLSDFIQVGRITFNFTQHYTEKMSEQMRNPLKIIIRKKYFYRFTPPALPGVG